MVPLRLEGLHPISHLCSFGSHSFPMLIWKDLFLVWGAPAVLLCVPALSPGHRAHTTAAAPAPTTPGPHNLLHSETTPERNLGLILTGAFVGTKDTLQSSRSIRMLDQREMNGLTSVHTLRRENRKSTWGKDRGIWSSTNEGPSLSNQRLRHHHSRLYIMNEEKQFGIQIKFCEVSHTTQRTYNLSESAIDSIWI